MKIDFEKVLADYGLKVGDKVKIENELIYEIRFTDACNFHLHSDVYNGGINIQVLFNYDWEKVEPKKKVGDLRCLDMDCIKCPFNFLDCKHVCCTKLKDVFEISLKRFPQLEPLREWIEKELNKEVK